MTTHRKIGLLTGLMTSGAMSLALSGFFTCLAVGLGPEWPPAWGRSFLLGWPIAFALAAVLAEPIRHAAMRLAA